jgi:hypothetical protein
VDTWPKATQLQQRNETQSHIYLSVIKAKLFLRDDSEIPKPRTVAVSDAVSLGEWTAEKKSQQTLHIALLLREAMLESGCLIEALHYR